MLQGRAEVVLWDPSGQLSAASLDWPESTQTGRSRRNEGCSEADF